MQRKKKKTLEIWIKRWDLCVNRRFYICGGNWFLKDGSPREDCNRGLIFCNTHLSESSKEEMNEDRESREHKAEQTNPFHLWLHFHFPFHWEVRENSLFSLSEEEEEEEEGNWGRKCRKIRREVLEPMGLKKHVLKHAFFCLHTQHRPQTRECVVWVWIRTGPVSLSSSSSLSISLRFFFLQYFFIYFAVLLSSREKLAVSRTWKRMMRLLFKCLWVIQSRSIVNGMMITILSK